MNLFSRSQQKKRFSLGLSSAEKFGAVGLIALLLIWLAIIGGWVANLFKFVYMIVENGPITAMFFGRICGVFFPPLGAVLGYF